MKKQTLAAFVLGAMTIPTAIALIANGAFATDPVTPVSPAPEQHVALNGSIQVPDTQEALSDSEEAVKLAPLAKITADEARKIAQQSKPGEIGEVELENKGGSLVYTVEITDAQKQQFDIVVDAGNGTILQTEADAADSQDEEDKPGFWKGLWGGESAAHEKAEQEETAKLAPLAKIPLTEAQKIATQAQPGEVEESELHNRDGNLSYSITILQGQAKYRVEIDANTGKILTAENKKHHRHDNDDNDKRNNEKEAAEANASLSTAEPSAVK